MQLKTLLMVFGGLAVGFIAGFVVANSINRSEIDQIRSQMNDGKKTNDQGQNSVSDLTADEIQAKIDEADREPGNVAYQKNLGLALYRYGAIKNDAQIIGQAARLLDRASKLTPADVEVTVGAANAWFDVGYLNKDNDALQKARTAYLGALSKNPRDGEIITDVAMTHFLEQPPNDTKAIDEFKRALAIDPKNEKALQFVIQAYLRTGDKRSAADYLNKLRQINPTNETIDALSDQLNGSSDKNK
jgi:tetratricopeptide (TPR) repeat protein